MYVCDSLFFGLPDHSHRTDSYCTKTTRHKQVLHERTHSHSLHEKCLPFTVMKGMEHAGCCFLFYAGEICFKKMWDLGEEIKAW